MDLCSLNIPRTFRFALAPSQRPDQLRGRLQNADLMPRHPTSANLLRELHDVRNQYTLSASDKKRSLLETLEGRSLGTVASLARYHDDLLFLAAFPDDLDVANLARCGLDRIPSLCGRIGRRRLRAADGTGMAGTTTECVLGGELASWLVQEHPGELEIDWAAMHDTEVLDVLLRPSLAPAEEDGFESGEVSTREWIRVARGNPPSGHSDLDWLLRQCPKRGRPRAAWIGRFDDLEIPLRWQLTQSRAATTSLAWTRAPRAHRRGLRPAPRRPRSMVSEPLKDIVLLDRAMAEEASAVARTALATRGREVHAISCPNFDEVYLADLDRGVSLILIGARADSRMSLETNYGYVILANGIPYGYGGVTPLFFQANTGANVFPAFRRSEAAAIYAQVLRAFRSLFGVTRFVANPYQIGEGNPEAIASGAFWFYYRLGFRPRDTELRGLAASEFRRIKRDHHRTDRKTLVRLGGGDLVLELPGTQTTTFFDEGWLGQLGLAVTDSLASIVSDRSRTRQVIRRVAGVLAVTTRDRARWKPTERDAFDNLAPLAGLLDLATWPARDRRKLVEVMRSKGAPQERDFVLQSQKLPRLFHELATLARARGS